MDHVPECRFWGFLTQSGGWIVFLEMVTVCVYMLLYILFFFYYFDYFYNFGLRTGDEGDDECSESDKSVHECIEKVDGNAYTDECKDECERT